MTYIKTVGVPLDHELLGLVDAERRLRLHKTEPIETNEITIAAVIRDAIRKTYGRGKK